MIMILVVLNNKLTFLKILAVIPRRFAHPHPAHDTIYTPYVEFGS